MAAAGEAADINKDVFTTSNDSTTAFTLSFTPAEAQNVLVFVDNIFQESTNNYTVSGTTLTMTAALHNGARLVVLHGFDGAGGVSGATWIGGSNTDIDSAVENVDTFTTSTFRSAEYSTGNDTTAMKLGAFWTVNDKVSVRGSFQTSQRHANLAELYQGIGQRVVDLAYDPCGIEPDTGADPIATQEKFLKTGKNLFLVFSPAMIQLQTE